MVQASMRVLCIISMHGWANQHRTTYCNSPLPPPPSYHYLQAHISYHPKGPEVTPNLGDRNLQNGIMAALWTCLQRLTEESKEIQETSQNQ
jgi:hypothetical protein